TNDPIAGERLRERHWVTAVVAAPILKEWRENWMGRNALNWDMPIIFEEPRCGHGAPSSVRNGACEGKGFESRKRLNLINNRMQVDISKDDEIDSINLRL
ncbi:hypothetical protein XENORESO_002852, partial [Xenotaenia resolanae]